VAIGAIVVALIVLATFVAMPAISHILRAGHRAWLEGLRWPVTIAIVGGGLAVLYWLATPHARRVWHVVPGAIVAMIGMIAASMGLSFYVTEASYGNVYGTFGSVLVVILWFYVCSLAVLIGAITNYELRVVPAEDTGASATW
jgi:membrane protein